MNLVLVNNENPPPCNNAIHKQLSPGLDRTETLEQYPKIENQRVEIFILPDSWRMVTMLRYWIDYLDAFLTLRVSSSLKVSSTNNHPDRDSATVLRISILPRTPSSPNISGRLELLCKWDFVCHALISWWQVSVLGSGSRRGRCDFRNVFHTRSCSSILRRPSGEQKSAGKPSHQPVGDGNSWRLEWRVFVRIAGREAGGAERDNIWRKPIPKPPSEIQLSSALERTKSKRHNEQALQTYYSRKIKSLGSFSISHT